MRALMKAKTEPGLTLTDVEVPEPGPGEVRIKVKQVGICGTDLHIYNWDKWASSTIPVPMVVGHEFVGHIDALGGDVKGLKLQQRVSGEGHIICGTCRNCRAGREHFCRETIGVGVNRAGAFAEYLVLPQHNVYLIPDNVSDDFAALLDPYGNAVHTALGFDLVGEDVLITGAGPIGLMAAAICRHAGARHIVVSDVNENRLALAEKMGASAGLLVGRDEITTVMKKLGMSEGFDIGLEMSGAGNALNNMIGALNNGGQIGLLGLFKDRVSLDLNKAIFKGLRFKGVYGREMFDTWHKGLSMLQTGLDISPVITHKLPFENYEEGFAALNQGGALKVLLQLEH